MCGVFPAAVDLDCAHVCTLPAHPALHTAPTTPSLTTLSQRRSGTLRRRAILGCFTMIRSLTSCSQAGGDDAGVQVQHPGEAFSSAKARGASTRGAVVHHALAPLLPHNSGHTIHPVVFVSRARFGISQTRLSHVNCSMRPGAWTRQRARSRWSARECQRSYLRKRVEKNKKALHTAQPAVEGCGVLTFVATQRLGAAWKTSIARPRKRGQGAAVTGPDGE